MNADLDRDGIVDGDFEATTATTQIGLGARKWLEEGATVTLFVEAGLVSISAKAKLTNLGNAASLSDTNSATGFWVGGGLIYPMTDTLNLGDTARMSQAAAKSNGESYAIGGTILLLTLQYHAD